MATAKKKKEEKAKKPVEKVYIVKFAGKSTDNDTNDVFLGVNGRTLVLKRGIEIPLPQRFIECAQNSKYNNYSYDESGNRTWISSTDRYPMSRVRESSWKEYLAYLKGGKVKHTNQIPQG